MCLVLEMDCLVCGKKFLTKDGLKRHLQRHVAKPHMCSSCDKSFYRKDELRAHMRTHEVTDKDHLICDECGMKLKSKSSLYNHRNMVHKHRVFGCSLCSKVFASKFAMESHKKGHGLPEECKRCHKTFKRLDDHKMICLDSERKR